MDRIIRQALVRWGWSEETSYTLLAERENKVYLLKPEDSKPCVLRAHRQHYRSDAELDSELQWMIHLTINGLAVPCPLPSTNGVLSEVIDDWQMDCLSLLDGTPLGSTGQSLALDDRLGTFRRIGQTMARLHQVTDDWQIPCDFSRPDWNSDGLLGEQPLWRRFWDNPQLSAAQATLFKAVREKAQHTLDKLDGQLDYGLIHADMVRENIFVKGDEIQLLDFDDSGFGFRLFEVATALFKNRDEPDYEQLEQALLEGYRAVRPLDTEHLPLFMLLRACTYVGWIVLRLDESGGQQRCERFINEASVLAEEYMANE